MSHKIYMSAAEAPNGFRCDACSYYPRSMRCDNKVILQRAKDNEGGLTPDMITPDGLVTVDAGGCSDEFESRGDDFSSDSEEKE